MLIPETPFPQVGSYALLVDDGLPRAQQEHELARILRLPARAAVGKGGRATKARAVGEGGRATRTRPGDLVLVSFPLRDGASGTKLVDPADLTDATLLSGVEQREFHDLDRALAGVVGKDGRPTKRLSKAQRAKKARRDGLHERMIYGPILDRLLRFARARAGQQRRAA